MKKDLVEEMRTISDLVQQCEIEDSIANIDELDKMNDERRNTNEVTEEFDFTQSNDDMDLEKTISNPTKIVFVILDGKVLERAKPEQMESYKNNSELKFLLIN